MHVLPVLWEEVRMKLCELKDSDRTVDNTRACECEACIRWWCDNVEGYFFCPQCRQARLLVADGPYSSMCEECFDNNELKDDQ